MVEGALDHSIAFAGLSRFSFLLLSWGLFAVEVEWTAAVIGMVVGREMFITGCNGKEMEERERWSDGQGRRRNGWDARSKRRARNQRRGGAGMSMGSLVLSIVGRNLLVERGSGQLLSRRW
jgi:hypothetical protein